MERGNVELSVAYVKDKKIMVLRGGIHKGDEIIVEYWRPKSKKISRKKIKL